MKLSALFMIKVDKYHIGIIKFYKLLFKTVERGNVVMKLKFALKRIQSDYIR